MAHCTQGSNINQSWVSEKGQKLLILWNPIIRSHYEIKLGKIIIRWSDGHVNPNKWVSWDPIVCLPVWFNPFKFPHLQCWSWLIPDILWLCWQEQRVPGIPPSWQVRAHLQMYMCKYIYKYLLRIYFFPNPGEHGEASSYAGSLCLLSFQR